MKIHRVWINIGNNKKMGKVENFCEIELVKYCSKYKHRLYFWTEVNIMELLEKYPQYIKLYNSFKYGIMKVDFIRWLILYEHGGLYVDCDILINTPVISTLFKLGLSVNDVGKKDNNIIYSIKGNEWIIKFLNSIEENINAKNKIKIYEIWKARYVLQTTGHRAIERMLDKEHPLNIYDLNTFKIPLKGIIIDNDNAIYGIIKENKDFPFIHFPSYNWVGVKC